MTVRLARYEDLDQIVDLFEEAVSRSRYDLKVDRTTAKQITVQCIASEDAGIGGWVMFVSEVKGEITGLYAGMLQRFYLATDAYMASPLFWYVKKGDGSAWRLMKAFEEWTARVDGNVILRAGFTDGIEDPSKFTKAMVRKGYRVSGLVFEKEI